jgi:uncharacterized repeat protein (TIGR03803 family)
MGWGTAYLLSPDAGGEQTRFHLLHTFRLLGDGGNPAGGIVFDSRGNAYGSTLTGGASSGNGTIYQLRHIRGELWKFRTLYSFVGDYTGGVQSPLLHIGRGVLYGAGLVGPPGWGGIFKLSPTSSGTWTYSVVYNFPDPADGAYPAGLIVDSSGHFFGVTSEGGTYNQGVIFEIPSR